MLSRKNSATNSAGNIYYISPYLPDEKKYEKHYSPAAQSKVDYIRTKLAKYNTTTVCVNCSLTVDNSFFLPTTYQDEKGVCRVLLSKSTKRRAFLRVCGALMLTSVFIYVLFKIGREDTVILYHSVYYDDIVIFLKKIKKFRLVYEVEEIYADVRDGGKGREKEIKKCESAANAFIFPTEMLDEAVNRDRKEYVVIYGAYNPQLREPHNDSEKTLVVYSGTLMAGKGATQAAESARALNNTYEIRLIGYGSNEEIRLLEEIICKNKSKCRVVYDGMKYGKDYYNYLLDCHIGLCIQPENQFNASSFPSKVLNYLNCGLKVVATEIEALKKSKLADYISFATDSNPEEVAKAIQKARSMTFDYYDILYKLDMDATSGIERVIKRSYK